MTEYEKNNEKALYESVTADAQREALFNLIKESGLIQDDSNIVMLLSRLQRSGYYRGRKDQRDIMKKDLMNLIETHNNL